MRISLFYFTLVSGLLLSQITFGQWRGIYQDPDSNNQVYGVSFYNNHEGFVAFDEFAGFTQDSGHTFIHRPVTLNNVDYNGYTVNLTFGFAPGGIKAFNKDTLLFYGDYGLEPSILRSENGGLNWKIVYHADLHAGDMTQQPIKEIIFPQNNVVGYAINGDRVLRTIDGGKSWQNSWLGTEQGYNDIDFLDSQTGFLVGANSLLKTTNGGNSWLSMSTASSDMRLLSFVSNTVGYVIAHRSVYRTNNGGGSWSAVGLLPADPTALYFINDSTGFASCKPFGIYKTKNAGKVWELMQGSADFSYLGYGFNFLYFFNNQLAWAGGGAGYLAKTDNGGGQTYPDAAFNYKTDQYCSNNVITLVSNSLEENAHRWYKNGVLFSTSYTTSYTPGNSYDTIRLIVTNAIASDTAETIVPYISVTNFSFVSQVADTNVCAFNSMIFFIPNSDPGAQYNVCRLDNSYCGGSVYGNGGTLTLTMSPSVTDTATEIWKVQGFKNTACGQLTFTTYHRMHLTSPLITIASSADTICIQNISFIKIHNSRVDYRYWSDSTFPTVQGTGGTILLPVRINAATGPVPIPDHPMLSYYDFGIYDSYVPFQCATRSPWNRIRAVARMNQAKFEMLGKEYFTGDEMKFRNSSIESATYKWVFEPGSTDSVNTQKIPVGISYSTTGQKRVKFYAYSPEGCVDSSNISIEVLSNTPPPSTQTICNKDSITSRNFYNNRDIVEDQYGNYYLTGSRILFGPSFYPAGKEGWFLMKFNKNKQLVWKFEHGTEDSYFAFDGMDHIVMENVVADKFGYTYVFGQASGNFYIRDGSGTNYPIARAGGVLIKFNPNGKIIWVKSLYNNSRTSNLDYRGGSLLQGKNDELYIITHLLKGNNFYINNDLLQSGSAKTGLIIHLDRNGNILDTRTFPAAYNNLRAFYGYTTNFDMVPKSIFDPTGKIAIFTQLDPAEVSGNQIDDAILNFNVNQVKSAILYYDTASKKIVSANPVYEFDTLGNKKTVDARSITIDSLGNYYAGFKYLTRIRPSSQANNDSTKPKGAIIAYDGNGNYKWRKNAEGFEPYSLQAFNNKLFATGTNYAGSGYTTGFLLSYPNNSPIDTAVNKITAFFDSTSYQTVGIKGVGSMDFVLARLDASSGTVETINSYGTRKEENAFIIKKGYGDQLFFTGEGNFHMADLKDSIGTMYIMRTPINTNCATTYQTVPTFLTFDNPSSTVQCTDTTIKLRWSYNNVNNIRILYSIDGGNSFQLLKDSLPANAQQYIFNPPVNTTNVNTLYKIHDLNNTLLSDTLRFRVERKPNQAVVTALPSAIICGSGIVTLKTNGDSCSNCTFRWNTGATDSSLIVSTSGTYNVTFTNACGSTIGSKAVTFRTPPVVTISISRDTICQGSSIQMNGNGATTYAWSGPNISATSGSAAVVSPVGTGVFTYTVIGTTNGCSDTATKSILVMPNVAADLQILYTGCPSDTLRFTAQVQNGGVNPNVQWYVNNVLAATGLNFTLYHATNGQQIKSVLTSNLQCVSPRLDTAYATVNCTATGVPEIDALENYSVSPNPTNGNFIFSIKLTRLKTLSFEITDSRGHAVYRQQRVMMTGEKTFPIRLNNISAGIYYMKVWLNNDAFVHKIIIAR